MQGCLLKAAGAWGRGTDLDHAPAPQGAGWSQAAHPLQLAAPCLRFPTSKRGRAGDWGHVVVEPRILLIPPHRHGFRSGGGPWGGPCCAEPLSCPMVTAPHATLVFCPGDNTEQYLPAGQISLRKHVCHHVPMQRGPAPVPIPIPGTVCAVTQHFNSSGVDRARGSGPPGPPLTPHTAAELGWPWGPCPRVRRGHGGQFPPPQHAI